MIFRFYIIYNKHDDDKNWQSHQRKTASIIASDRIILLSYFIEDIKKTFNQKREQGDMSPSPPVPARPWPDAKQKSIFHR